MRQFFLAVFLIALLVTDASAITWGKLIEFRTGVYVNSIRRTKDGGVILYVSQSHFAKLNAKGDLEWQKSGIVHAVETPDGAIVAIGVNNGKWFLTKFSKQGNQRLRLFRLSQ
jgi:hypothetical protein